MNISQIVAGFRMNSDFKNGISKELIAPGASGFEAG